MKICHITFGYPPTCGGTETHNYTLSKYLAERGYEVEVIAFRTNISKDKLKSDYRCFEQIRVHNLFPRSFPVWIFQLRRIIKEIEKEGKIDIIDVHSMLHILPFLLDERKIITSLHFFELVCPGPRTNPFPRACNSSLQNCWNCCGLPQFLKWKLIRFFTLLKTTKFMVKYDYLKHKLIESGIPENKIAVVPHWIDVEHIHNTSNSPKVMPNISNQNYYNFVFFGRLAYEKGPDILLEAFIKLNTEINDVNLIIIGDGPLRTELEKMVKVNKIEDRVYFTGMVPHSELFNYLSLADAFVFPHRFFNYEWALLEAMCTEKPIIATDMPATTDILKDGYNALLAEPTLESIYEKMKEIISTPSKAKEISKNALGTVRKYHSSSNLIKYEELINEVAD